MSEFIVFLLPHPVEESAAFDMVDWLKENVKPEDYQVVYFDGMDDPKEDIPVEIHVKDPEVLAVLKMALSDED